MPRLAPAALLAAALAACGTPPNQRMLTRTSDYLKAMSFGFPTGHPLEIAELERRFPELKGIVITAAQWVDEYEKLREERERKGESVYEYRIPHGANITLEVTGEPTLTRTYSVPPSGYVYFPFLSRLRVAGLTQEELKASMEKDLAAYLRKPEVLVHVNHTPYAQNSTQPFLPQAVAGADIVVMGMSRNPFYWNFAFTGNETLIQVLGRSDLPPNAEWRQIRVIRRDRKDPLRKSRVIICDLWDYFAKADVRQDIPMAPGDVVFVPLRWSADDQFWEDWGYVKRVMTDLFFLDEFRDGVKKGGALR
jgi:polysaccharide export outer membrane protein